MTQKNIFFGSKLHSCKYTRLGVIITAKEPLMFTETELHELLKFQSSHPVLSVYLNTDTTEGTTDYYKHNLRSMLKGISLQDDVFAVERFFDHEYDWSGQSVVIFSCAPENFLKTFSLAVPLRSRVRVGHKLHVKPLADILDAFGGYGVALVDKQGARLFYFHLGELLEQEGTVGETVRRTKRGGSSQFPGRRGGTAGQTNYAEEVAERNMREAADFAAHFFADKNVRRVLIGGTEDNLASFRSLLPKAWQSLIVGTFSMSMTASKDEVLARAMEIGQLAEQRREAQLVNTIVTNAAKGRGGVTGLDQTLHALHEGRVHTLIIREGFQAQGYVCQGCGYLTAHEIEVCPFCGKTMENIPDAVEMAVHKVMEQGSEVEVLHDAEITEKIKHIGAQLHY
jgi:peptide chain release factor subunit 1